MWTCVKALKCLHCGWNFSPPTDSVLKGGETVVFWHDLFLVWVDGTCVKDSTSQIYTCHGKLRGFLKGCTRMLMKQSLMLQSRTAYTPRGVGHRGSKCRGSQTTPPRSSVASPLKRARSLRSLGCCRHSARPLAATRSHHAACVMAHCALLPVPSLCSVVL